MALCRIQTFSTDNRKELPKVPMPQGNTKTPKETGTKPKNLATPAA